MFLFPFHWPHILPNLSMWTQKNFFFCKSAILLYGVFSSMPLESCHGDACLNSRTSPPYIVQKWVSGPLPLLWWTLCYYCYVFYSGMLEGINSSLWSMLRGCICFCQVEYASTNYSAEVKWPHQRLSTKYYQSILSLCNCITLPLLTIWRSWMLADSW